MRIYKIYAQCCRKANPICEISKEEAYNEISETISQMLNNGESLGIDWEDEKYEDDNAANEAYNALYSKAVEYFCKNGYFECGDFCIAACEDDEEPERANSYGWTNDFLE